MLEKEYIEREAIIHKLNNLTTEFLEHNTVQGGIAAGVAIGIRDDVVATAPTADVVEVKRGEWIWTESGEEDYEQYWVCSCCGDKSYIEENYCPNCGAKMDGKENGNAE